MIRLFSIIAILLLVMIHEANGQVVLPRLVRDSMILQRDATINIWGWAGKGEKIKIEFNGKNYKTTTAEDGKWYIALAPMKAGGPYAMNITGTTNRISIKDILIGDVWVCAGQSNMVHQMELHKETYANELANANYPAIRQFWVPTLTDLQKPKEDLPAGNWKSATAENVRQFSAVAYFFAKDIYDKYKIPIGLINTSVGGTPVEAWTSEEGLKNFPDIMAKINKNKDSSYINGENRKAAVYNAGKPKQIDKGLTETIKWYDINYTPKQWHTINIPGYWEDQGIKGLDGVVWYRKEIEVPESATGIPAKLFLGRIVDADFVYINGVLVGNTSYQYPQRKYPLAAGILKKGKNIIVIRVINNNGKGGFVPDKPYYISAGDQLIDLKGYWQYKVGDVFTPSNGPSGIALQNQPAALFNAMTAPLINYSIKGFLWYQGETNTGNPSAYNQLFPALISDWRKQWKMPAAPFIYAQLPNFMEANYLPTESNWALLREAQFNTLSVPNTGMAVTIDLGEWNDIHPDNKKSVADRLALAARKIVYGENIVHSGPLFQSSQVNGNKIILQFSNTGSGLTSNDGEELSEFAIAGADKKFVWAKARIENDKIIVWEDGIQQPLYVRYAWSDNPVHPNLYNKEGLPASPFRTDK